METPLTNGSRAWEHQPYEVVSAQCKVVAAHSTQMAKVAAVRADYDAKVAELMADLEVTRSEREKMDTDLTFLKSSSRTERLKWNKERKILNKKVAEADARAREACEGIATAEEFIALQKQLAAHELTIRSLREELDAKEAEQDKLQLEAACGSTVQGDVEALMVRSATLEQTLAQEREARKMAEQEAEARSAEARGLERRLAAALEAAARAEETSVTSVEDVSKITKEVRDARAGQRQAELWLEKCLAEVDAVHAVLAYERSVAAGTRSAPMQQTPYPVYHSMQTPHPNPHRDPPSPAYDGRNGDGGGDASNIRPAAAVGPTAQTPICRLEATVGPTAQTPTPESPTSILADLDRGGAHGTGCVPGSRGVASVALPEFPATPTTSPIRSRVGSDIQTPDLDVTRRELFSTSRLRARVGGRGRGMGFAGEDGDDDYDDDLMATTVTRGGGGPIGNRSELLSPPTPTVLFGELAGDGGSTTWGAESAVAGAAAAASRRGKTGRQPSDIVAWGDDVYGTNGSTVPAAAEAMTMRMATTPTKDGRSSRAREDVAASLLTMLRLETSKRKKAEARAAELEAAAAPPPPPASAAEAATTVTTLPARETVTGGRPAADGDRSGVWCVQQVSGYDGFASQAGSDGQQQQQQQQRQKQPDPDWLAHYARMDQERQGARILSLVKDARKKLGSDVGGLCGGQGGKENGGRISTANGGGPFPVESSSPFGEAIGNPSSEVASLIQEFDDKLARTSEDNTQLRVFCAHLEGLLAASATANGNTATASGGGGGKGAGDAVHRQRLLFSDQRR